MNSFVTYPHKPCPLNWRKTFAPALKKFVVFLVLSLGFCVRPATIFGAVMAVWINPINRMFFGWSFTHVGKKVFKRLPSVADRNSTASVIWKIKAAVIFTSATHHVPSVVFFCRSSAIWVSALSVLYVCRRGANFLQATARLRMFASQLFRFNGCKISARAFANPVSFFAFFVCAMDYCKLTVDLALHVNKFGHLEYLYD